MSFKLAKDEFGRASAIENVETGWYYVHLVTGSIRNEANAQALVDVLNAAEAVVNNPTLFLDFEVMGNLRRALAAFKKEGGA